MADKYLVKFCMFGCCLLVYCCSCKSLPPDDPSASELIGREYWAATNLHVLSEQYVHWQNYLDGIIFPWGTSVRFTAVNQKFATFVNNHNKTYIFYWRGESPVYQDKFAQEIGKYFVDQEPVDEFSQLTQEQKNCVQIGEVKLGMPKKLVLLSWGHPPDMVEPLKQDTWVYWLNEWQKCILYFKHGLVAQIVR